MRTDVPLSTSLAIAKPSSRLIKTETMLVSANIATHLRHFNVGQDKQSWQNYSENILPALSKSMYTNSELRLLLYTTTFGLDWDAPLPDPLIER